MADIPGFKESLAALGPPPEIEEAAAAPQEAFAPEIDTSSGQAAEQSFFNDPATIIATVFGLAALNAGSSDPTEQMAAGLEAVGGALSAQQRMDQATFAQKQAQAQTDISQKRLGLEEAAGQRDVEAADLRERTAAAKVKSTGRGQDIQLFGILKRAEAENARGKQLSARTRHDLEIAMLRLEQSLPDLYMGAQLSGFKGTMEEFRTLNNQKLKEAHPFLTDELLTIPKKKEAPVTAAAGTETPSLWEKAKANYSAYLKDMGLAPDAFGTLAEVKDPSKAGVLAQPSATAAAGAIPVDPAKLLAKGLKPGDSVSTKEGEFTVGADGASLVPAEKLLKLEDVP